MTILWMPDLKPEPERHGYDVDAASVAKAKQAQAVERAAFTAATGVAVDDDGRLALLIGNAIWDAVNSTRER